jgi:hypothetical protein
MRDQLLYLAVDFDDGTNHTSPNRSQARMNIVEEIIFTCDVLTKLEAMKIMRTLFTDMVTLARQESIFQIDLLYD